MVNLVNLTLENKMTYYVTVMAADESLQCDVITLPVTVDTTPPKKGHVDVGPFINIVSLFFTVLIDKLTFWKLSLMCQIVSNILFATFLQ